MMALPSLIFLPRIFIRNLHTSLEQDRLFTIVVSSHLLRLGINTPFALVHIVERRERNTAVVIVGVHERIESALGATAAERVLCGVLGKAARSRLAVAAGGGFADEAGCEVLEEAAEGGETAAHDKEVGFDETGRFC